MASLLGNLSDALSMTSTILLCNVAPHSSPPGITFVSAVAMAEESVSVVFQHGLADFSGSQETTLLENAVPNSMRKVTNVWMFVFDSGVLL